MRGVWLITWRKGGGLARPFRNEVTFVSDRAARVAGRVALVTGAARGQERAESILLAREGADIIGLDICGPIPTVAYPSSTPADLAATGGLVESVGRFEPMSIDCDG